MITSTWKIKMIAKKFKFLGKADKAVQTVEKSLAFRKSTFGNCFKWGHFVVAPCYYCTIFFLSHENILSWDYVLNIQQFSYCRVHIWWVDRPVCIVASLADPFPDFISFINDAGLMYTCTSCSHFLFMEDSQAWTDIISFVCVLLSV